nr:RHS repeat-associated core domain-containing protein [Bacteroides acidifaciens]
MTWTTSAAPFIRGYRFEYDQLSRLKNAAYGEGEGLSLNINRFNEQVSGYDKQGNILGLQRYGQTGESVYGLVDDLTMIYEGNQLKSVTDTVSGSAYANGFDFRDGSNLSVEYCYDANGNLIKDLNKNIIDIQYNFLNLPCRVEFENGNSISYLYDANGTKLRTTHVIGNDTTVTDYCGNVIYENGAPKTLLVEGGYVSLDDNKYHYFIQDHQGNNRVVVDQDGKVEEVNDYYPFGGLMASSGDVQPYKYNGKELNRKGGLDWYDYGARMYDAALGRWHTVDPSCEKYYNWSPYTYCKNNPVLRIDLDGKDDYVVNEQGKLFNQTPPHMRGKSPTDKLSFSKDLNKFITVKTGLLNSMYKIQKGRQNQGIEYYGSTMNLDDATAIFKFGADNTKVEWKLDIYDNQGEKTAIVGTSGKALSVFADVQDKLKVKGNKIVDLHSHPEHAEASDNDMKLLRVNTGAIYYRDDQKLLFYTSNKSKLKNEEYTVNTSKELLKRLNDKFMK